MRYSLFPKIEYDGSYITDNTVRVILKRYLKENINYFFEYTVKDTEKPEDIAFNFYGDPKLHWLLLIANDIINPWDEWPKDYLTFLRYLEDKYLPSNLNANEWHHFENEQGTEIPDPINHSDRLRYGISNLDFNLNKVKSYRKDGKRISKPISEIETLKYQVTNKDYEEELNDQRRLINIPHPNLVDRVEADIRSILSI